MNQDNYTYRIQLAEALSETIATHLLVGYKITAKSSVDAFIRHAREEGVSALITNDQIKAMLKAGAKASGPHPGRLLTTDEVNPARHKALTKEVFDAWVEAYMTDRLYSGAL